RATCSVPPGCRHSVQSSARNSAVANSSAHKLQTIESLSPFRPLSPMFLFSPFGEASTGHALAQPAFFEKILFEPPELLIKQVARQFDQADHHIGGDERVGVFD